MAKFRYLLSYSFSRKIGSGVNYYTESGTGRMCLNLDEPIKSDADILNVEHLLFESLQNTIEHLESVSLYSFSFLSVVDN